VIEYKLYVIFLFTLLIGLILLSHDLPKNGIVIYGDKMDKKNYNNDNFQVYNDYLIRDPSEYGMRDSYKNPTQFDKSVDADLPLKPLK